MFHRFPAALFCICLGLGLLGIIGSILPVLSAAEENLGLHLLYRLRGTQKPPADVVVIAIDRESAKALDLPVAPQRWPRILHARLLKHLKAQGATVVAFDLIFHESQSGSNDQAFASAIRRSGNVVLTQSVDRQTYPLDDQEHPSIARVNVETIVSAVPAIADAALCQAPFPLPKVPVKLNQYWRFSPGAADLPTLPVVAVHVFALDAFAEFVNLVKSVDPSAAATLSTVENKAQLTTRLTESIQLVYRLFRQKPSLVERVTSELEHRFGRQTRNDVVNRIRTFIRLYGTGSSRYLNLYGPSGTIQTISYHRLLESTGDGSCDHGRVLPSLKGKAVFIGQTESDWFKTNDGFYTDLTGETGVDISGVEIAATAFANILEDKAVHPLEGFAGMAVFCIWGALGTLLSVHVSTAVSAIGLVSLNGLYAGLAYFQFAQNGVWCPLVVPILIQSPAAFITGLAWKYRKANMERRNIRKAFGHYLPDEVVERLTRDINELCAGGQVLYSICLFTDAESYTTLSEKMDPENLTRLTNNYYEAVFKPIKDHQGLVLQVIGDSVLALWTASKPEPELKAAACRAAVGICRSVHRFNSASTHPPLPTRIGLHAGEIVLGNIGALNHFEYRPVGDIVNTASRLEGLNKFLGTYVLISEEAFVPHHDYLSRPVGRFVFKGKSHPVRVREIITSHALSRELQAALCRIFTSGLQAFEERRWNEAEMFFKQALEINHDDGPSRFYLEACREFSRSPPDDTWDGAVHLKQK